MINGEISECRKTSKERRIPTYSESKEKYGTLPPLILPIKGCWLRKIWAGEKREEYRDITPYYEKRLGKYRGIPSFTVGLRGGYRMDSPFASCLVRLREGKGLEEWGAESGKDYFVLEIIKVYK